MCLVPHVGFRGLGMGDPGHDAFEIDANRNQNMLEMGFRHPNVARPSEIKGPYSLRQRAFNARPRCILRLEGGGRLVVARRVERII